jgi:hypothetical protein
MHKHTKRKSSKEKNIHALTRYDLDNIGDQVKEVIEEGFMKDAQKQEEMHTNVHAQIATLRQILESTRIALTHIDLLLSQ